MTKFDEKKEELQKLTGEAETSINDLKEKTGPLKKIDVMLARSKNAGNAIITIEREKIKSETNIALTSLKLGEATIRSALVANAMPQIGAITTQVNMRTTAVDQQLTNGCAAQTYTHVSNRDANVKTVKSLQSDGKINAEEAEAIISFLMNDAAEDIRASRKRMLQAKEAVSALHEFALTGIAKAKDLIN